MSQEPDPERPDPARLAELEKRLAKARGVAEPESPSHDGFRQSEMAWRMVIEMVSGLGIGFAIGYGLDTLLGTLPIFLVVFTLLGFVAGMRVMLRTAAEMNEKRAAAEAAEDEG